jgi:hypothetical protein
MSLLLGVLRQTRNAAELVTYVGAWALLVPGLLKILSLLGSEKLLHVYDPVLHIPNWIVFGTVGVVELTTCWIIVSTECHLLLKESLLGILGIGMLAYRILRVKGGIVAPCGCLGEFSEGLPLTPEAINMILLFLIGLWLVPGLLSSLEVFCRITIGSQRNGKLVLGRMDD